MTKLEFSIPLSREDLLKKTNVNHYVVNDIHPIRTLHNLLKQCENSLKSDGIHMILKNFDFFYSVIEHFNKIELDLKLDVWKLIIKTMSTLTSDLHKLFENKLLDTNAKLTYLNSLKMSVYVLISLVERFEFDFSLATEAQNFNKVGKKKAPPPSSASLASSSSSSSAAAAKLLLEIWEDERELGMQKLLHLLQLSVQKLWGNQMVEEEFVRLISESVYKILERTHQPKMKQIRETISHIIAIMVKDFGHLTACVLKLLQQLQQSEQLVTPLVQMVELIHNSYGNKVIVSEIMRELGHVAEHELASDSTAAKSYGAFLLELSKVAPSTVLQFHGLVMGLLENEPYTMRNSVLAMMGELMVREMKGDNLDEGLRGTKEKFFDSLEEHIYDSSAFVRSRVLQVWTALFSANAVPMQRKCTSIPIIIGRVWDKMCSVRKSAVQALVALMNNNTVVTKFLLQDYKFNYDKEVKKLETMIEERRKKRDAEKMAEKSTNNIKVEKMDVDGDDDGDATTTNGENENDDDDGGDVTLVGDDVVNGDGLGSGGGDDGGGGDDDDDYDMKKQRMYVDYLKMSISYLEIIEPSVERVIRLLSFKTNTDVIEAINFFVSGYKAGVIACMAGIRAMIQLVWSEERDIKTSVVEAYKEVFINVGTDQRTRNKMAADSMISLVMFTKTQGEISSLEEMIQELVRQDCLNDEMIQCLWQRFTFTIPETTARQSLGALTLIGYIANIKVEIIRSNIDILIEHGLSNHGDDCRLVTQACAVLSLLSAVKLANDRPFRLPIGHRMEGILKDILIGCVTKAELKPALPMIEQVVKTIYGTMEFPDKICAYIIKTQASALLEARSIQVPESHQQQPPQPPSSSLSSPPPSSSSSSSSTSILTQMNSQERSSKSEAIKSESTSKLSSMALSRFLGMCCNVALQQFVHLEMISAEIKRRKKMIGMKSKKSNQSDTSKRRNPLKDDDDTSDSCRLKKTEAEKDPVPVGDDLEAELIRKVAEFELLSDEESLLGLIKPIIVLVCSNQVKFGDPDLYASASLALAKFMVVSSEFCESHLRLFFTILEKSNHPVVRGNLVVAVGDLMFRFPNSLEPWTGNVYNRLRDDSTRVRLTTVHTLTRLIFNDMIKVKGQVSELALCILDDDPRVASASRQFFTELSKKPNAIYNLIPDVVSRLSELESKVNMDQFKPVMKFLMPFIDKEKQSESLIEKLCHRIRATAEEKQCQDLIYCFTLLPATDKCICKLNENVSCFADKLSDPYVLECLETVISNGKKLAKPNDKNSIEEFENKILTLTSARDGDEVMKDVDVLVNSFVAVTATKNNKKKPLRKGQNKINKGPAPKNRKIIDDDDDDDENFNFIDDYDSDDRNQRPKNNNNNKDKKINNNNNYNNHINNTKSLRPKTVPALRLSSSDDDDIDFV